MEIAGLGTLMLYLKISAVAAILATIYMAAVPGHKPDAVTAAFACFLIGMLWPFTIVFGFLYLVYEATRIIVESVQKRR